MTPAKSAFSLVAFALLIGSPTRVASAQAATSCGRSSRRTLGFTDERSSGQPHQG